MKALPLLLAASLVANAALVTTVTLRKSTDSAASAGADASSAANKTGKASARPAAGSSSGIVDAIKSENPDDLRDFLRAAGVPEDTIRMVVASTIWKRYGERMKSLHQPDPNQPWWKSDRQSMYGSMSKEKREEMKRLQAEATAEMERVLGPDKNNMFGNWSDPRMNFLPEAKRKDLQKIEQDYNELISEVQQDMQGFSLPSDGEKLRFLQEEKKRDIEAMMTPEERLAYDLRMSNTANQLRWRMTKLDATEAEYLRIFPLQKAFDDAYSNNDQYGGGPERTQDFWKQRSEAEKQLKDQIKAALGPDRYTDYVRAQDNDFQQLENATRRLALPSDTPDKIYAMRTGIASEAQSIADNPNIAADQKKAAFAALAEKTRGQVRASLGTEAGDAVLKNSMRWIKEIEKGNVVTFNEDGNFTTKAGLPKDPP